MKRPLLLIIATLLTVTACDSPTRSRTSKSPGNNGFNSGPLFSSGFNNTSGGQTEGSGTGGSTQPTPTPTSSGETTSNNGSYSPGSVPSDAQSCSWSTNGSSGFGMTHPHVGDYTLCQSSTSETIVYIQVKTPIPTSAKPLCIIPTTHAATNGGNNSTYIGEPRCLFINSSTEVYRVDLYKNRFGYGNYPLTGAMLMKDELEWYDAPFYQYLLNPDAYLFCSQWLAQTGDSSYCYAFDSAGNYVYHQF